MTVLPIPQDAAFGRLSGQFTQVVADSADVGDEPDFIPAQGSIVFTPEFSGVVRYPSDPIMSAIPKSIEVPLDENGAFVEAFLATDVGNPSGWTYKVTFNIAGVSLSPFSIDMPSGSDRILNSFLPTGSSNGVLTLRGDKGDKGDKGDTGDKGIQGTPGTGSVNLPELARNLVPNPSFEIDATGWTGTRGTVTTSAVSPLTGVRSAILTTTDASLRTAQISPDIAVTAGKTYTVQALLAPTAGAFAYLVVQFGTAPATYIENSPQSPSITVGSGRTSLTVTVPAGRSYMRVIAYHEVGANVGPSVGSVLKSDAYAITEGATLPEYFDGSMAGCYWTGAANASASVKGIYSEPDVIETRDVAELVRNLAVNPKPQGTFGYIASRMALAAGDGFIRGTVVDAAAASFAQRIETAVVNRPTAIAGQTYFMTVEARTSVEGQALCMFVNWMNAAGASVGSATGLVVMAVANAWTPLRLAAASPVGTVRAQVYWVAIQTGGSAPVLDQTLDVRSLIMTRGQPVSYFDGDSPGCRWAGVASASESVKMFESAADHAMLVWLDAGRAQGIGKPEGIVTAPVGARYVDTLATNGAVEWTKFTGSGNVGWKVTTGYTGRRAVINDIAVEQPGFANGGAGGPTIIRDGNRIHFSCPQFGAPLGTLWTPPLGFRPAYAVMASNAIWRGTTLVGWIWIGFNGGNGLIINGTAAIATYSQTSLSWITEDPWPTALPGSPA